MARRVHVSSDQLSLDFGAPLIEQRRPPKASEPAVAKPTNLLFFGLRPSADEASQTRRWARQLAARFGLRGPLRPPHLLHMTLHPIAHFHEAPDWIEDWSRHAVSRLQVEPFDLTFDRSVRFHGSNACVLRCEETPALRRLQRGLSDALSDLEGVARYRFTPHVTLLYDEHLSEEAILDAPLTWTVRDFELIHSFQGQSRYRQMARFVLQ